MRIVDMLMRSKVIDTALVGDGSSMPVATAGTPGS
jgi:hypothetical protein